MVGKSPVAAGGNDPPGGANADSGDPDELFVLGPVYLDGKSFGVVPGPAGFRVYQGVEVSVGEKSDLVDGERIQPEKKISLVKTMLPHAGGGRVMFQGCAFQRLESGIVSPVKVKVTIEEAGGFQDLTVGFARGSDYELSCLVAAPAALFDQGGAPAHSSKKVGALFPFKNKKMGAYQKAHLIR